MDDIVQITNRNKVIRSSLKLRFVNFSMNEYKKNHRDLASGLHQSPGAGR